MIDAAEKAGHIKPDTIILETMSIERRKLLKALGRISS